MTPGLRSLETYCTENLFSKMCLNQYYWRNNLKIDAGKSVGKLAEFLGNIKCPECNKRMEVRKGRYSYFLGCSGYPYCNGMRPIEAEWVQQYIVIFEPGGEILTCPNCGSPMKAVRGRRGVFLSCSAYPACRYTKGLEVIL